jgi:molecular chaperone GrpE
MSKKANSQEEEVKQEENPQEEGAQQEEQTSQDNNEIESLKKQVDELKDKHLRLYAEFDNFRKRTARERIELLDTAGKDLMVELLPILDDFQRAKKSIDEGQNLDAVKEGVDLIYNKFFSTLKHKGLKPMESIGQDFDADRHEALTEIPAPSEDMKGKVVDEIEKGYLLNDRIIRYAKVVVGK